MRFMQLLMHLMRTVSISSNSPPATTRKLWSLTKAKGTFIQIIFAFLSKALVKMTSQKKKY